MLPLIGYNPYPTIVGFKLKNKYDSHLLTFLFLFLFSYFMFILTGVNLLCSSLKFSPFIHSDDERLYSLTIFFTI